MAYIQIFLKQLWAQEVVQSITSIAELCHVNQTLHYILGLCSPAHNAPQFELIKQW